VDEIHPRSPWDDENPCFFIVSMKIYGTSMERTDFHYFPKFLGKSGMALIHRPSYVQAYA
jgi:hypothetical protein